MIFVRNALQEAAVLDFLLYLVKIFLLKVVQKSFAICREGVKTVIILRLTRAFGYVYKHCSPKEDRMRDNLILICLFQP